MTDHRPLPDHLCSDNWPMDNVTERSPTPDRETTDTSPTLHIDHLSVDISTESQSTLDRQKDRHINRLDRYSGRYVKLFFSRCVSGRYSTNLEIWLVPLEGSILPSGPLKRAVSHPCGVESTSTFLGSLQIFSNVYCFAGWTAFIGRFISSM